MCDLISEAAATPGIDRRNLFKLLGAGTAAAAIGTTLPHSAPAAAATATTTSTHSSRTRLVLLGTAGGPAHMSESRFGISTALVYQDKVYMVDLGLGAFRRLVQAGLAPDTGLASSTAWLRGILFTHLHSDHTVDWPAIYATATMNQIGRSDSDQVHVYGPGARDTLPRVFPPNRPEPELINPDDPMPGISTITSRLRQAFANDFNDRLRDSNFPDPGALFNVHDIDHSSVWQVDPAGMPPRLERPIQVWDDGDVQITATLVDHRPTAPAYAYRFDTPDGSVVISGDTTVSDNLIDLAQGTDYLVHEVIDPVFVDKLVEQLPPDTAEAVREHLLAAHTTIEQVGRDVAEPAGAKNLVLNHYVPGTAQDGTWKAAERGYSGRLILGKDLMTLPVG